MSEDSLAPIINDYSDIEVGDMYPHLPIRLMEHHLDDLLAFGVAQGASDIKIYANEPLIVKVHGKTYQVTERAFSIPEVFDFVSRLYGGANGITRLASANDNDVPYEVKPDRFTRYRFRVSMTSMQVAGERGARITLRTLPAKPISVKEMGVPQDMIDAFKPSNGLVLVTGATGSGKSTLLAGIIRDILETPDSNTDILTFESPIEFVYDEVDKDPSALISQSDVPRDIRSFSLGVRNALRNNPDIILVGEMRDPETITAGVEASITGHVVYSTLHSNSVSMTVKRLLMGAGDGGVISVQDIIDSLRMVVSQRLLPRPGGGRTAIREYLKFDLEDRERLISADESEISMITEDLLESKGVSFERAAKIALDAGAIFERDYLKIKSESRGA